MSASESSSSNLRERLQASLGRAYALERELGGGGMARVFVATETALGRRVVVKVLPPELSGALSAERFRREIRVAAQLSHPHIVPLHAAGEAGGLLYYTMPYVEGESLRQRLVREAALSLDDTVRLVRELADALACAHEQGVVHRDLKPENVLLARGHAVVTDFGVAKALQAATLAGAGAGAATVEALTSAGFAVGTPAYMAPEQAVGDPATDHRADLYALGAVAYELLAGVPPFTGRTPQALVTAHLVEPPPPLAERRADVPPWLGELVMRLLAKQPDDRPQSADEVVRALGAAPAARNDAAVTPPATPPSATLHRRARASGRAGALVAAILAVLVTGAAITAARRERPVRASGAAPAADTLVADRVVVATFENKTGDRTLDPLGAMTADWLARGLAGTGVVDVAGTSAQLAVAEAGGDGVAADARSPGALARRANAGIVVAGAYYRQGDSLLFQADIRDARSERLLQAVGPVAAPIVRALDGVERLSPRVLGGLAAVLDASLADVGGLMRPPPSYEAYRELLRGEELLYAGDSTAGEHFLRAAALDSTYLYPLLEAMNAFGFNGRRDLTDSIGRVLEARRARLTPFEAALLDYNVASYLRPNPPAIYAAAQQMVRLAPKSQWAASMLAWVAVGTGRPREAVALFARLAPEADVVRGRVFYYTTYAGALHTLGEHARELAVVRQGRREYPNRATLASAELHALAALGQLGDFDARVAAFLELPPEFGLRTAQMMEGVVCELRAHGHPSEAQAVAERVVAWVRAQPAADRAAGTAQFDLPAALAAAQQWSALRAVADSQARANRSNVYDVVGNLGYAGFAAAMQGDRAGATRIVERLARLEPPHAKDAVLFWRAQIAAALGDSAKAVALIRELLGGGFHPYLWHPTELYMRLREDPGFQALTRPRG